MLPLQRSAHHRLRYIEEDRGFDTPCWIWQMCQKGEYAGITVKYRFRLAHRWFYEQLVGPIPDGHDIHHRCEQKLCVNPAHMAVLTEAEHVQEHHAGFKLTHCKRGHEFTPQNTRIDHRGARACRRCVAMHSRNRQRRLRQQKRDLEAQGA